MILCAGECLVDMLPRQIGNRAMLEPVPGGSVMNTAVGLGRLQVPVEFFTGLSGDQFGRMIGAHLRESRVGLTHVVHSDRPTTLAFVELTDDSVTYDFYDENSALRMLEATDLPQLPDTNQAIFCGGISLIHTPAAEAFAALVAQNPEKLIMLDPNIRPKFIPDSDQHRARLARMLRHTDIVKTSDEDLAWLFPGAATAEAGIQQLLDLGAGIVLFTEGAKGATAWRDGKPPIFVASEPVEVVDTVGAGDTFNAGFLAGLYDQNQMTKSAVSGLSTDALTRALAFAAKCAAHCVGRVGAQPPWREEVTS